MIVTRKQGIRIGLCLAAAALATAGQDWLRLGWQAWDYPVAGARARTQIVVDGAHAYIAAGVEGIEVVDLDHDRRQSLVAPGAPLDRIDDLAVAGGLLFALDATLPGYLQVYALDKKGVPTPLGTATPVAVGPFSGVSAAAGLVAVSGGTSQLSLREYDTHGMLGDEVVMADYGRGQPDVALRGDGRLAVVSTHRVGPEFGLTLVGIERAPLRLHALGQVPLPAAGFTRGGYKPAHFPLVVRFRGERIYFVDGGGLGVIDAADPHRPRLVYRDAQAAPAMDLAVAPYLLDVATAGDRPAIRRYRFNASGVPTLSTVWHLPDGERPAAIARAQDRLLISTRGHGWRAIPRAEFSPAVSPQATHR